MSDVLAGTVPDATVDAVRATGCAVVRGTYRARRGRGLGRRARGLPRPQRLPGPLRGGQRGGGHRLADLGRVLVATAGARPPARADGGGAPLPQRPVALRVARHPLVRPRHRHRLPRSGAPSRAGRHLAWARVPPRLAGRRRVAVGREPARVRTAAARRRRRARPVGRGPPHRRVEVESPVGSTVFRTFQGWTALSDMQPADGVLHVAPVPVGGGVPAGPRDRRRARPATANRCPHRVRDRGDELVERALVPIPAVAPGDTVWWHGDLYHSVADAANDTRWGNVMYIGVAPRCARNDAYGLDHFDRFVRGAQPARLPGRGLRGRLRRSSHPGRPVAARTPAVRSRSLTVPMAPGWATDVTHRERATADGGFPLRTRATSSVPSVVSRRPAGRWLPLICRTVAEPLKESTTSHDDDRNPRRRRR